MSSVTPSGNNSNTPPTGDGETDGDYENGGYGHGYDDADFSDGEWTSDTAPPDFGMEQPKLDDFRGEDGELSADEGRAYQVAMSTWRAGYQEDSANWRAYQGQETARYRTHEESGAKRHEAEINGEVKHHEISNDNLMSKCSG